MSAQFGNWGEALSVNKRKILNCEFPWFLVSKTKFLKPYKDKIIVINVLVPSQEKHYQNSYVWRTFSFENKHKKNRPHGIKITELAGAFKVGSLPFWLFRKGISCPSFPIRKQVKDPGSPSLLSLNLRLFLLMPRHSLAKHLSLLQLIKQISKLRLFFYKRFHR